MTVNRKRRKRRYLQGLIRDARRRRARVRVVPYAASESSSIAMHENTRCLLVRPINKFCKQPSYADVGIPKVRLYVDKTAPPTAGTSSTSIALALVCPSSISSSKTLAPTSR